MTETAPRTWTRRLLSWLFLSPRYAVGGEIVFADLSDIRIP